MASNEYLRQVIEELDALSHPLKPWDQGFVIDMMENEVYTFTDGQAEHILRMEKEYLRVD